VTLLFGVLSAGCETTSKQDTGTVIGGILGGIIGYQVDDGGAGGAIIGTLVGGAVGRMIGSYMDKSDREKLAETIEETPSGQTVSWHNDNSGHDFEVTPTTDTYAQGDRQCRKFDQVVYVDGRREVMEGTACKDTGSQKWDVEGSVT
jgi:surface antigen